MLLVTGFGPYDEAFNASGMLVQSLVEDLPQELESLREQLSFALFNIEPGSRESEHRELEQRLRELLHQHSPSVCIHTGQAPVYNKITVERLATNSFQREAIDLERSLTGRTCRVPTTCRKSSKPGVSPAVIPSMADSTTATTCYFQVCIFPSKTASHTSRDLSICLCCLSRLSPSIAMRPACRWQ